MQAKEYVLDERSKGQAIQLDDAAVHLPEDERIQPGAVVTLKLHGTPIDVEVLDQEHEDTWVGTVRGFEGHAGRPFRGIVVGDVLRFWPQQIFEVHLGDPRQSLPQP